MTEPTFDLIVRHGLIVDGSGGEPYAADVAIKAGRIAAVGSDMQGAAGQEIDAKGCIVTPGFVDIHTHYDGHITWANRLAPSSNHGVTTVVTGNCGVGFAPCKPEDRDPLLNLMEGVEDIPEPVMTAGLPWNWQSFPEYLDSLDGREYDMDVATQVPHAPIRVFVMGERGVKREAASADDIAQMAAIAREAVEAGALGFTTSRTINHHFADGSPSPVFSAAEDELTGIALALKAADKGVLQLISDFDDTDTEFDMLERIAKASGRPMSISVMQQPKAPARWNQILDRIHAANESGARIKAQVCGRPVGLITGLAFNYQPFVGCPSYQPLAALPLAERAAAMRDPDLRARLIDEARVSTHRLAAFMGNTDRIYELAADDPDYEPGADDSVAACARRQGQDPLEYFYDRMTADGGTAAFMVPQNNFQDNSIDAADEMLRHPDTILGLGDGGAHCGILCDASLPTYMLTRWARGRAGRQLPLPLVVKALTSETAAAVGLDDRGRIAPGLKADLNIIDFDQLTLHRPEVTHDLPAGGARVNQRASGFRATIVSGIPTYRDGEPTGALPGRLVRGAQTVAA